MDLITKYRLNTDWFFPTDESDFERNAREEIFELIKNHDMQLESKVENRDAKISHLVGDEYNEPLLYLNPYLDVLFGKIDYTMSASNIMTFYTEENLTSQQIKSKPITCQTIPFDNVEIMSEWVDRIRKDNELFIYLIESNLLGTRIFLRFATFPKDISRVKLKRSN